jgi:tetratricopeptide (TPR) repeat protein
MISDFEGDAVLPDALFWISKEYEWAKGPVQDRSGWYDAPNSVYERLVQKFKYGQAEWDYKRLTHRMKIFNLMKEADQNEINAAIEQMVAEFTGRPEVVGELYWIACGYEERPDKGELAKQMYERIVKEYPDTVEANEARLDIPRVDIQSLIEAGDINEANKLTDEFISDFNQNPYAGECLGRIAIKYYKTAMPFKVQGRREQTKQYFAKSENLWQWVIDNNFVDNLGEAYFCAATCRQELGRWEDALAYYYKVVDDYNDYEYVCGAQCAIGWSYEVLRDSGKIPKEQANPIIEQAYTAVLTKYPDCYVANYAAFQLAGMMLEKGDKAGAVVYYKKFLELAKPQDVRIASVKETLSRLEGISK